MTNTGDGNWASLSTVNISSVTEATVLNWALKEGLSF